MGNDFLNRDKGNLENAIVSPVLRLTLPTAHDLEKVKRISRVYKYKITCC